MKIKRNVNTNATNFEYLSEGTVFKTLDGRDNSLYMKIKEIEIQNDFNNYIVTNAIDLGDGESMCFNDCDSVIVVDGEFVTQE